MKEIPQIQSNFNAGELSPKTEGRVDLEKYFNGCRTLENYCILPYGGITRRPGMRYITETKTSAKKSRLIPFEFSVEQAYALEFGDQYIRVLRRGFPVTTPGSELVTNGTFAANANGWTDQDVDAGISAWNADFSGSLRFRFVFGGGGPTGSDIAKREQGVTTVVGETYTLSFMVKNGDVMVKVGSASGLGDLVSEKICSVSASAFTYSFTATSVVSYIQFYVEYPTTGAAYIDDVSCAGGGVAHEVVSPYLEVDLPLLKYTQSADVLYLVHPLYAPRKLMRYSDASWELATINFRPPPTSEHYVDVSGGTVDLTLAALTGTGITATTTIDAFLAADAGRTIKHLGGLASVITVVGPQEITIDITNDFSGLVIAAGDWELGGSPVATLTPSAVGPVGAVVTVTLTTNPGFRAADVGKYVRGNSGLVRVVTVDAGGLIATGEVLVAFATTTGILGGAWTLESADWNATDGYPSAVCFFEQRLFFAGSAGFPTTLWGSQSGDYENFNRGALDADAVVYAIASNTVNTIRWIVPTRTLLVGTAGGEFRATGGGDTPLTPSNVDIKSETTFGSAVVTPIRIGASVLFLQRAQQRLRDLEYALQSDGYTSSDLTLLAEHITSSGVVDMDYQQEPDSQVWLVRADGVLLSMTYVKGQQVVGWARHITDGIVESVCVIPDDTELTCAVYLIVNRTIEGVTKRYVEILDPDTVTDSNVLYSGASTATITGLGHLEGETVKVVADGEELDDLVVASGAVILPAAATEVEVGLEYTPQLVTVRPEVSQMGTAQGRFKRWSECWARVLNTRGLVINNQLQEGSALASEDIRIQNLGYDRDGRITITQPHPYPSTILALFGTLSVED